ncbi:MAG TPA: argininosuccinate lyase [Firmicutes bacterium]|nr:argininosuccinate lyase [Bacillota bacterium]
MGYESDKPWGGRFKEPLDKKAEAFGASIHFDRRLAQEDIKGSIAHCSMLVKKGILTSGEGEKIIEGLQEIKKEILDGKFIFDPSLEDIHMNIEKRLTEKIGPLGGKLHTGRSRNDQVALDMHLYVKKEAREIERSIILLQQVLLELAEKYLDIIFPGYTHLQRAQPILFSHHLMAYFWMLQRDRQRFVETYQRADMMPLGAGALSGTGFPIDREEVASSLDFGNLYENSMDAVSDRDFVLDFLYSSSLVMMHLSRLSEELVLWSTREFSFIELGDAFTTGSSMMPQKKNPDIPELARGKTGRVYGNLLALLVVLKGLPLAYNKDMQEDKEPLFDTVDTIKNVLSLFADMLRGMTLHKERIEESVKNDFSVATELADYLARRGIPFREAHAAVGHLVRRALESKKLLGDFSEQELNQAHPLLALPEARALASPYKAVEAKKCRGGTAPEMVREQLRRAKEILQKGSIS